MLKIVLLEYPGGLLIGFNTTSIGRLVLPVSYNWLESPDSVIFTVEFEIGLRPLVKGKYACPSIPIESQFRDEFSRKPVPCK